MELAVARNLNGITDEMNVVLIGYRCSGKSAVGRVLARELERDFLDMDELMEKRVGCSIEKLVFGRGWDHFRDTEKRLVKEVSKRDNLVIATGGGVVMDKENVINLKHNAWVVWLNGKAEVLRDRMAEEHKSGRIRPSLTGADSLEEITEVLSLREPLYKTAAELIVDTSGFSVPEVTALIIRNLPKGF
jgi:shikimate kinase